MTNPRDDLMALADRLRALVFRQGHIDWDALIKIEIDLRLAASRPATQVVDREAVAQAVTSELEKMHEDGVPMCMREGEVTWRTYFAGFDLSMFAIRISDTILSLLRPAEPVEAEGVGEPVAWQWRSELGGDWRYCSKQSFEEYKKHAGAETRALYTHPPKSPDISAAVLQSLALEQALNSLAEIASSSIPDCPSYYSGDELAWAQRHVSALRHKAEIARDGIAAAIRQLPTATATKALRAREALTEGKS